MACVGLAVEEAKLFGVVGLLATVVGCGEDDKLFVVGTVVLATVLTLMTPQVIY
jgi:hypothetical protein